MRIVSEELKLSYDEVLLKPRLSTITSRSQIDLATKLGPVELKVPIIASNMDKITGAKMAGYMDSIGAMGVIHRNNPDPEKAIAAQREFWLSSLDRNGPLMVSVGSINKPKEKQRLEATVEMLGNYLQSSEYGICVDIANGHSTNMIATLKYLRETLGFKGFVMAGAVCTPRGVLDLHEAGADAIRVGIGPGSACTTRIKTGCGYPQFSAVKECAETGVPIIADGGIRDSGDAAKALGAGAKAIMIGGMLAGTDCVPDWDAVMDRYHERYRESIKLRRKLPSNPVIEYRGMASNAAKTAGGIEAGYEEGISTTVEAKGPGSTKDVINRLKDGIVSAMSYQDSRSLPEFYEKAEFIRVAPGVVHENHPHFLSRK